MNLHILPSGPIDTNAFLLTSPDLGEALLIDAPGGVWAKVEPLLKKDRCRLSGLWLTHGHWDHLQGAAEVLRATNAKVAAHPDDRRLYEAPQMMAAFATGVPLEPVSVDRWVSQGDRLPALGVEAEARHVPGHCPGSVVFYFPSIAAVFAGDTLFRGSVGRTDLPGGDSEVLAEAIRAQLYSLPDKTAVYPGHGPATTVAAEKANNPFVRG